MVFGVVLVGSSVESSTTSASATSRVLVTLVVPEEPAGLKGFWSGLTSSNTGSASMGVVEAADVPVADVPAAEVPVAGVVGAELPVAGTLGAEVPAAGVFGTLGVPGIGVPAAGPPVAEVPEAGKVPVPPTPPVPPMFPAPKPDCGVVPASTPASVPIPVFMPVPAGS